MIMGFFFFPIKPKTELMFRMSCFENFRNREFLLLLQMRHARTRAGGVPDVTVRLPWAVLTLLVPTAACGQLWKAGTPLLAPCSSYWAWPTLGTWMLVEFQGKLGPRVLLLRGGCGLYPSCLSGAVLEVFKCFLSDSAKKSFFSITSFLFFQVFE